jgi:glycosyltransferase involved in cell wall biosynthesis
VQPENLFLNLPKFIPVKMMNKIFYKYLVWVYKKVDITICPSKFSEKLLKNVLPSLKTEVVSNGVDNLKFKRINPNSLIDKFKIKGQCKKIVFVGRLHPEKNVETLVKSLKQEYPNVQAVIAGFGYMQDSLESTANKLNLKEDIIFCGKVSDNDLIKVYSLCDIFVSPSLAELEGMAILEAMSCKNPIVIADSKESAAVQFVKENGFLFEPENPRDLARKILILLKDKKLRRKMAQNSLDESRNYSINKSISNLEKIYYSALQKV